MKKHQWILLLCSLLLCFTSGCSDKKPADLNRIYQPLARLEMNPYQPAPAFADVLKTNGKYMETRIVSLDDKLYVNLNLMQSGQKGIYELNLKNGKFSLLISGTFSPYIILVDEVLYYYDAIALKLFSYHLGSAKKKTILEADIMQFDIINDMVVYMSKEKPRFINATYEGQIRVYDIAEKDEYIYSYSNCLYKDYCTFIRNDSTVYYRSSEEANAPHGPYIWQLDLKTKEEKLTILPNITYNAGNGLRFRDNQMYYYNYPENTVFASTDAIVQPIAQDVKVINYLPTEHGVLVMDGDKENGWKLMLHTDKSKKKIAYIGIRYRPEALRIHDNYLYFLDFTASTKQNAKTLYRINLNNGEVMMMSEHMAHEYHITGQYAFATDGERLWNITTRKVIEMEITEDKK